MWVVWITFDPWWLLMNSGYEGVTATMGQMLSTPPTSTPPNPKDMSSMPSTPKPPDPNDPDSGVLYTIAAAQ